MWKMPAGQDHVSENSSNGGQQKERIMMPRIPPGEDQNEQKTCQVRS
jgi:hypothetical protein